MGLRFLADHCISNRIIRTLRDTHHEVVRLRDLLESPQGFRLELLRPALQARSARHVP